MPAKKLLALKLRRPKYFGFLPKLSNIILSSGPKLSSHFDITPICFGRQVGTTPRAARYEETINIVFTGL